MDESVPPGDLSAAPDRGPADTASLDGAARAGGAVWSRGGGQCPSMDEGVPPGDLPAAPDGGPEVTATLDGDVSSVRVTGELTEAARRPPVRVGAEQLL